MLLQAKGFGGGGEGTLGRVGTPPPPFGHGADRKVLKFVASQARLEGRVWGLDTWR